MRRRKLLTLCFSICFTLYFSLNFIHQLTNLPMLFKKPRAMLHKHTFNLSGYNLCESNFQSLQASLGSLTVKHNITQYLHEALQNFYFDQVSYVKGCISPTVLTTDNGGAGQYRVFVRLWLVYSHNRTTRGPYGSPYNALVMMDLNSHFQLIAPVSLLSIPTHLSEVPGTEDPRAFTLVNSKYGKNFILFGSEVYFKSQRNHWMHIWSLERQKLFSLVWSKQKDTEKNWSLIDLTTFEPQKGLKDQFSDRMYFVYSTSPLVVLQCQLKERLYEEESCSLFYAEKGNYSEPILSGGSHYYRFANSSYFYTILHTKGRQCGLVEFQRQYRNHIAVLHWPVIHKPFMRIVFISQPLEFPDEFVSLKPPFNLVEGFAYVASIFDVDESADVAYLGVHRSDLECWLVEIKGMFSLLKTVIAEDQKSQCPKAMSDANFNKEIKKDCSKWTKKYA